MQILGTIETRLHFTLITFNDSPITIVLHMAVICQRSKGKENKFQTAIKKLNKRNTFSTTREKTQRLPHFINE